MRRHVGEVRANQEGATIIEFALVAPIFFFLIFLMTELGLLVFTQVALESAMMQVSRSAAIGASSSGCDRVCTIQNLVQQKTLGLINSSNVSVQVNTLAAGGTTEPDTCIDSSGNPQVPIGVTASGGCICPGGGTIWLDNNNNGHCDLPASLSVGNAGDLVEIRVSYPWKLMIPFLDTVTFGNQGHTGSLYGNNGIVVLSSSTVVKNEPF